MKIYIDKCDREDMYYEFSMFESYKPELIEHEWYICEADLPENYYGEINIYPYQIVDAKTDNSLEFITNERFNKYVLDSIIGGLGNITDLYWVELIKDYVKDNNEYNINDRDIKKLADNLLMDDWFWNNIDEYIFNELEIYKNESEE